MEIERKRHLYKSEKRHQVLLTSGCMHQLFRHNKIHELLFIFSVNCVRLEPKERDVKCSSSNVSSNLTPVYDQA